MPERNKASLHEHSALDWMWEHALTTKGRWVTERSADGFRKAGIFLS